MDLKFQSSFIPRQPIISQGGPRLAHVNLISVIAIIIFIITIGLIGAVLIAKTILNRNLVSLDAQIVEAKNSFELSTIGDLKRESIRIRVAEELLANHIAFSKFLELLNQSTFEKVSYENLTYTKNEDGSIEISLSGLVSDFNTLVLQAGLFKSTPGIINPVFSSFSIDEESIGFDLSFNLAPDIILYKNYVDNNTSSQK